MHNQRIERLWGDLRRVVLRSFQHLFFYMESEGILQPDNEMHLFALHFVFLPRINAAVVQWNNHSIRKTGGFSSRQLYVNGIIDVHDRNYSAVQNIYDPDQGNAMFGVDDSDELEIESDNNVQVPQLDFP